MSITTSEYACLEFSEGIISRAVSAEGVETDYEFIESSDGKTLLRITDSGGAVRTYGDGGELVSIEFPQEDGAANLGFTQGALSFIESDGSVLSSIVLGSGGEIESARLMNPEGNVYFFVTGDLEDFIEDDNIEYDIDPESGRINSFTIVDTQEVFVAEYSVSIVGEEIITFMSETSDAMYRFVDRRITFIRDTKGIEVEYEYFTGADIFKRISIYFSGHAAHVYDFYEHVDGRVKIVDDANYMRYYGEDNRLERIETPYGETYDYFYYEEEIGGEPIPRKASNYSQKIFSDDTVVKYFQGAIMSVSMPDGTFIDDILFDEFTGELSKFTYHLPEGDFYKVRLHKSYTIFELGDGSMLVFSAGHLVAFASDDGYVGLYDELEGLDEIFFDLSEKGYEYYGAAAGEIDVAASYWRQQTSPDTGMLGITGVSRDYASAEWEVDVDISSGSDMRSGGEMYLDLRYDIPGLEFQAPIDMTGPDDRVSFYFRPDEEFTTNTGNKCYVQVFVKDASWRSQYGTPIEIDPSDPDTWREVFLKPSSLSPPGGFTDEGFDPSRIVMMGLRVIPEHGTPENSSFSGRIFVRENLIIPDLFANVNFEATPADSAYYDQGFTRRAGQAEYSHIENTLEYFYSAMANGAYYDNQKVWLDSLRWRVKTEADEIRGISAVRKNPLSRDEILITMDLDSSVYGKSEGEIFFNINNIVPGVSYPGPINLTGRKISMLVKAPEGFIGPEESPNGIRLFVEDRHGNKQYGTWTNIKDKEKWYRIDIMPTTGELPSGSTQDGFDPSNIVRVGINIAAGCGNEIYLRDDISAKFMPQPEFSQITEPEGMPVWMDLRFLKEYLFDQAGNILNVPPVPVIESEYFSYVLNRGSGMPPEADFTAIESSLTVWDYYGKYPPWQTDEANKGITSVSWDASAERLITGIELDPTRVSGEIELNLAYVPDRNWQNVLDMTTQKIKFAIKPGENLTFDPAANVTASIFVKCPVGSWPGAYSVPVSIDLSGDGTDIYMVPTVELFHDGFFQQGFDPKAVGLIGLKIQCENGKTVSGSLEIAYSFENITESGTVLSDDGILPPDPVWIDKRAFSEYIREAGIELFSRDDIFSTADTLSSRIPSYSLPSDFAAYTVFDDSDNVVSITRANGSTAWIDTYGRIDHITHRDGSIFVDYEYDGGGDLVSATLVSARKRIEDAIEDASFRMEKEKVDRMIYLDTVDEVVREEFAKDVARARAEFARIRRRLESRLYTYVKHRFLFWTWEERVEVPGVRSEIRKLDRREREFNRDIANKMAERDAAFREVKETVEAEFARLSEEYAWQRRKLLLSTARQEAVPIIHYYYWEMLGREPCEEELSVLFRRIDETYLFAGVFDEDIPDKKSFILRMQILSDTPFYGFLTDELKSFVDGFSAGDDISEEKVNDIITALDSMIYAEDLYTAMVSYYGSEPDFSENISETTLGYIDELETVSYENVFISQEYELQKIELSLIKDEIESFRDLKIELLQLLENPETIAAYNGYWKNNLLNIYDVSDLVLRNDRLYLRSFDDLSGTYIETELTNFLESHTAEFSLYGEDILMIMPGDLRSMEMAYAEFIDVSNGYHEHMEELLGREVVIKEWIHRGIIQDHFSGDIVVKDKSRTPFAADNLKDELMSREEFAASLEFKTSVIAGVMDFLNEYLADEVGRSELLADIGLLPGDVIDLTVSYAANIGQWLEDQNIHFGKSAFGSLRKYIEETTENTPDLIELSVKAILIDVLAGNIGPFVGSELEISMYTMTWAAGLYSAESRSMRFTWDDLASYEGSLITLINFHHYVTVVNVTENEVTYYEHNLGEDGGLVTLSREKFLQNWQGNVIVDAETSSGAAIQESETRKIRGAFIFAIIGAIAGFLISSITAVVVVATQVIAAVIAGIGIILEGIMMAMSYVVSGIGNLFAFIGQSFSGLGALSGIGTAFEGFISGFGVSSLVNPGVQTFIKIGVGYGISAGLDMMGVDPTVGGMVSAIVTGGVHGFFESGGIGAVFQSALQVAAMRGVGFLGEYLDLDPVTTNLLSMSTFALTGAVFDPGSFSEVMEVVSKNIVGELAYYGVTYAGENLGLAPKISHLAGIGIRSSLQAGLGTFGTGGGSPGEGFIGFDLGLAEQAFRDTLKSELPYLGLTWLSTQIGLDPSILNQLAPVLEIMITPIIDARTPVEAISNAWEMLRKVSTVILDIVVTGVGQAWEIINPENIWEILKGLNQSIIDNWENIMQTANEFNWANDLFDYGSDFLGFIWENQDEILATIVSEIRMHTEINNIAYDFLGIPEEYLDFIIDNSSEILNVAIRHIEGFEGPEEMVSADGLLSNISLNLKWPFSSELSYEMLMDIVSLFVHNTPVFNNEVITLLSSRSRWDLSTDLAAALRAQAFSEGRNFVFGGGINNPGLSEAGINRFYDLLETDKKISVGFSASTVETLKSMLIQSDVVPDHYFFLSPQFSPAQLEEYMARAGIRPDQVTIVETFGDYRRALGGDFSKNRNADGDLTWNHVKILEGPGVSSWNMISSHRVPIRGLFDGGEYSVIVNGEEMEKVSLNYVYGSLIEGD